MRIFVLSLSLVCFMPQLLSAADSSVPADGSGYLDDRKLQVPAAATPVPSKKKVKKVAEENPDEPAPVLTQVSGGTPAVTEGEGFPVVAVIVGVLVLAALIAAGVFFARRSKTTSSVPPPPVAPPVTSAPSVRSPTAAVLSRPPSPSTSGAVKLPPASGSQGEGISINGLSNNEISRLTSVDERGRNPSGIIIDEDKYFSGGKESFVDEDLS